MFLLVRSFLVAFFVLLALADTHAVEDPGSLEFFESRIRPVLVDHCQKCHSEAAATEKKLRGGLKLDTKANWQKGGESGQAIIPGKPHEGTLLASLKYDRDLKMPPQGKLPASVIENLEKWIKAGAIDPRTTTPENRTKADATRWKQFWAFRPPAPLEAIPQPPNSQVTLIDSFVQSKLKEMGLKPAPHASKRTLIRRVTFDLTGLPPTPEEVTSFEKDQRPDAYNRVVDRLLDSPVYGQRWARHWLDVVRYADYHDGNPKARNPVCEPLEAWRYRDWVVDSFNQDLPFDAFIRHQIAGDLLPSPDGKLPYANGLVATAFLVNGAWDRGDADKEKMVSDMVDDQIDTIGKAFLGLTLGCARCHDHKFDPVSQNDYYALAGIFYSTRMLTELGTKGGEITLQRRPLIAQEIVDKRASQLKQIADLNSKIAELDKKNPKLPVDDPRRKQWTIQRDQLQKELPPEPPMALAVSEGGVPGSLFPAVQDVPIHIRGSYTRLGPTIPRAMPAFFAGPHQPKITKGSGRLELANWVASPQNPLTARVIVNRVWQWHFGTGLVKTPNNFGLLSEPPSHPELLDWLTQRFIQDGWSIKKLHRLILLSSTYQQSSFGSPGDILKDPENRWLGRFSARRLEAEAIRDAMISVSGKLNTGLGGAATDDLNTPRRSLYVQTARWDRANFATLFDAANPDSQVEKRDVSTVAPQALFLLNHPFVLARASDLVDRLFQEEPKSSETRVNRLFALLFNRVPTAEEKETTQSLLKDVDPKDPKKSWRDLAHVLLCSNEFCYVD